MVKFAMGLGIGVWLGYVYAHIKTLNKYQRRMNELSNDIENKNK